MKTFDYYFKPKAERRWADPDHVKFADRVAAELGADVVKSYYTGDPDTFREVIRSCPVPIIVASGPMASDPEGLLKMVKEVMEAGAKGVIMGRNIWGYENMPAIMEAISKIVHEEESLERAIKIIK